MPAPSPSLVLSGLGIVSSVGRDAVTTCASMRAGLERRGPVEGAVALEVDGHEQVPIVGHRIRPLTDGFASVARWLQLAPVAFQDLIEGAELPDVTDTAFWRGTRILAILPRPGGERWENDPLYAPEAVRETLLAPLYESLGLPMPHTNDRLAVSERTGLFQTLAAADAVMAQSRAERLVRLAVDSLLDGASLDWLGRNRRLRTAEQPDGLAPGEAAVALLVEPHKKALARQARPLAALATAAMSPALGSDPDEPPNLLSAGRSLSTVFQACLSGVPNAEHTVSLSADLNGEPWKSKVYGYAFSRLPVGARPGLTWTANATQVGDLGAATSAFDVAIAARALERGYAPSSATLVAGIEVDGASGACLLTSLA